MAINMVVAYLLEMRGYIIDLILENFSLIDRMGEGLLILNEEGDSIEFASKPAVQLLSELPPISENLESEPFFPK